MYLEYSVGDGEKIGGFQTKKIRIQDLGKEGKVTLLKEEKKEEEKEREERKEGCKQSHNSCKRNRNSISDRNAWFNCIQHTVCYKIHTADWST